MLLYLRAAFPAAEDAGIGQVAEDAPDAGVVPYTKEDIQHIRAAVNRFDTLYGTDIVIFSPHRFSDWSVHEASRDALLHLVTMERLRY